MAILYTYYCDKCDYCASISGHNDSVFMGITETLVCNECNELSDYIVGTSFGEKFDITCDTCNNHNFTNWNYKTKPCPKCKIGKMKIPKDGIITITNAD